MRLINLCLWMVALVLGGLACQEWQTSKGKGQSDSLRITYPIPTLQPVDSTVVFLAEEGVQCTFGNGSQVNVPARAFCFSDGALVNGEVELRLTLYKDALDLFLDGYLLDNRKEYQQTAGGFKVLAFQDDKPLVLDPSRQIEVRLAGYSKEKDFALYQYNYQLEVWDSIQSVKQEINEARIIIERRHMRNQAQIRFPLNDQYFALNYQGILEEVYNKDLTNVNHPRTQNRMKAYGLRWSKINSDNKINFADRIIMADAMIWKNISRIPIPDWTAEQQGELIFLGKNRYELKVQLGNRKFTTQIEAIMPLQDLFSLGPGYWKKEYETKLAKIDRVDQLLDNIPQSYRSFGIYELGVYQWQKPLLEETGLKIQVQFKSNYRDKLQASGFFWLSEDKRSLVHFRKDLWDQIPLFVDTKGRFFCVTEDQRIIKIQPEQINDLDLSQLRKMQSPAVLLEVEIPQETFWNKRQFLELLD